MHITSSRTIKVTKLVDGKVSQNVSKERTNTFSPSPSSQTNFDLSSSTPINLPLANTFCKNKRDNHIIVPEQSTTGFVANNAKPVNRGGVGKVENYNLLKNNLLGVQDLYEDPDFPADVYSIYYTTTQDSSLHWKRPHEICQDPHFFVDGVSRFDVCQGELGDCWFLAAVASLSMQNNLFQQVVPPNQSFKPNDYCGAFHFNFWHYGQWKEVIIDDRLPVKNDHLVYMHSENLNEFWSALLEKAYAKLYGCYELLKGGDSCEAMEDFTGGLTENIRIVDEYRRNIKMQPILFKIMQQAQSKQSFIASGIDANPQILEAKLANGLIMGHTYTVTALKDINVNVPGYPNNIQLIRLRNPWGQKEWNGDWGDTSNKWNYISAKEKKTFGLHFDDDGEFWISFNDFILNFDTLFICSLGPQSFDEGLESNYINKKWEANAFISQWKMGVSAGGCNNFQDTFWSNPQFQIKVQNSERNDSEGTIVIGLLQKNTRSIQNHGENLCHIGYYIYEVPPNQTEPLNRKFFCENNSVVSSKIFVNLREVCGRHNLSPGSYVIIPCTFKPNKEAEFLLRIFSETSNEGNELDQTTKITETKVKNPFVINEKERQQLKLEFSVIAGKNMEIDASQLKNILQLAFKKDSFFADVSIDTCRSIVTLMDINFSGFIGFEDFEVVWWDLKLWKTAFIKFDKDVCGSLSSFELRPLISEIGFEISNKIFRNLVTRFSSANQLITFNDFIHCCVRLKKGFMTFEDQKKDSNQCSIFDHDTFIQAYVYS